MPEGQTQPPMVGVVARVRADPATPCCRISVGPPALFDFPRVRGIGIGQVQRLANQRHLIEAFGLRWPRKIGQVVKVYSTV